MMPLENSMENPLRAIGCPSMLNTGVTVVLFMYVAVGFSGYLKYGPETEAALTLNLPIEEPMAQSVKAMMSVAILLTYFLQFHVPFSIIMKAVDERWGKRSILQEIIMRLSISTATVIFAIAVPTLEIFMALVGALCLSVLGLILPPAMDTVVRWETDGALGRFNWRVYKNAIIGLIGVTAMTTGTYSSIHGLVKFYQTGEE